MTAPRFFHFANVFVLLAWSGVMLYFYASGRVDHILTENFRIAPLLGGLGLGVVGLFNLFTPTTQACCSHEHAHGLAQAGNHDHVHAHDHDHDHDHTHHEHENHEHAAHDHAHHEHSHAVGHTHDDQSVAGILVTLLIVLVPAIGGAALSQDKFSVQTLANKGLYSNEVGSPGKNSRARPKAKGDAPAAEEDGYTLADLEKQVRKSEDGNFLIPIPSLFYSAADEELADVLQGQPVETTGQVAPEIAENDPQGTRLRLYRLFISCCLADARPIGFSADFGQTPPEFAEDTWVKIVGSMHYPEKDGRRVPVLTVDEIEAIPEPEDQMY